MHTPAGVTVTTAVTAHPDGDAPHVELIVANDGPDIDPAILRNMFGRFVRADKSRSRELGSSGLGLAIVASILEAHHGSVDAESHGGRTEFRIRIPMTARPGLGMSQPAPVAEAISLATASGPTSSPRT